MPIFAGAMHRAPRVYDTTLAYARALVDGISLRKAASRANICLDSSFRWRHRMLANSRNKRPVKLTGIVEADETFILKSAKGSKKLVGRAPRKRGGKEKKKSPVCQQKSMTAS